jgi:hypothetical protein
MEGAEYTDIIGKYNLKVYPDLVGAEVPVAASGDEELF